MRVSKGRKPFALSFLVTHTGDRIHWYISIYMLIFDETFSHSPSPLILVWSPQKWQRWWRRCCQDPHLQAGMPKPAVWSPIILKEGKTGRSTDEQHETKTSLQKQSNAIFSKLTNQPNDVQSINKPTSKTQRNHLEPFSTLWHLHLLLRACRFQLALLHIAQSEAADLAQWNLPMKSFLRSCGKVGVWMCLNLFFQNYP